jgi:hypothetical protein
VTRSRLHALLPGCRIVSSAANFKHLPIISARQCQVPTATVPACGFVLQRRRLCG